MLARQPAKLPLSPMEGPSSPNLTDVYGCASSTEARDDSGVSTMGSVSGKDFEQMSSPNTVRTLADILLSEHNNNYTCSMDVVKLLRLRSVDDEQNQQSNSSSLESLSSLENNQGSQGPDVDGGSGTTSCSEDSFEMSSTCSVRDTDVSPEELSPRKEIVTAAQVQPQPQLTTERLSRESRETTCESFTSGGSETNNSYGSAKTLNDDDSSNRLSNFLLFRQPPTSISMDSFMLKPNSNMSAIRESINLELKNLDTGLPELDFAKLEEQLKNAAREREEHDRRLLGEEVRRRLALQADSWKGASPAVSTRPHRSNLALRLQTAMNLQVCYMNELSESASESEVSESEDEFIVPKSRSTPNLKGTSRPGSSREDPYLQKLRDRAVREQHLDPCERQTLLHAETKTVLENAKKAAQTALDHYRRSKSRASGVPRQARQYLRKMSMNEVLRIKEVMEEAIDKKNLELVQLLIERDGLHMEHDSLLVDIDDFTEHEAESTASSQTNSIDESVLYRNGPAPVQIQNRQCAALDFPHLLGMIDGRIIAATKTSPCTTRPPGDISSIGAPTPAPTPTSPTKAFVAQLPKSLSRFVLFRR